MLGGHTGWYDAVTIPIVGGVTVWGFAQRGEWVSPGGAQAGDTLLLTKGPSIEASALLAILYRDQLLAEHDKELVNRACARADQITVVADALLAFEQGGVHAMHDATEGGVLGGLWEMSAASGLGIEADLDAVAVPADIALVASALEFDPWCAISEGTLLASVDPAAAEGIVAAWREHGIEAWPIGRVTAGGGVNVSRNARVQSVDEPETDPFWDLFFAGLQQAGG
ncbi:MAG: hypothetical protein JXA57_15375 [Armatimonadetes bacterium]|nr:hypothetical protein [Armatimonadota bacterium]